MHYNIKTTDFSMTPEVSKYLDDKLVALEKFIHKDDESIKCDVEIGRTTEHHQSGDIFRVEINVSIGKTLLRAESVQDSIFAAIDDAQEDITRRLRRHKGKNTTLFRRGGKVIKDILRFGRR